MQEFYSKYVTFECFPLWTQAFAIFIVGTQKAKRPLKWKWGEGEPNPDQVSHHLYRGGLMPYRAFDSNYYNVF